MKQHSLSIAVPGPLRCLPYPKTPSPSAFPINSAFLPSLVVENPYGSTAWIIVSSVDPSPLSSAKVLKFIGNFVADTVFVQEKAISQRAFQRAKTLFTSKFSYKIFNSVAFGISSVAIIETLSARTKTSRFLIFQCFLLQQAFRI